MTIRQARILAEMTQAQVAKAVGVHANTYAKHEKNPIDCKIGTLLRIAQVLHVDINTFDILRREDVSNEKTVADA